MTTGGEENGRYGPGEGSVYDYAEPQQRHLAAEGSGPQPATPATPGGGRVESSLHGLVDELDKLRETLGYSNQLAVIEQHLHALQAENDELRSYAEEAIKVRWVLVLPLVYGIGVSSGSRAQRCGAPGFKAWDGSSAVERGDWGLWQRVDEYFSQELAEDMAYQGLVLVLGACCHTGVAGSTLPALIALLCSHLPTTLPYCNALCVDSQEAERLANLNEELQSRLRQQELDEQMGAVLAETQKLRDVADEFEKVIGVCFFACEGLPIAILCSWSRRAWCC